MDEQLWANARLFRTDSLSDGQRSCRNKLITLFKKGGLYNAESLAKTIIANFELHFTAAWYLPSQSFKLGDKRLPAPSRTWRKAFHLMTDKGLLKRYKTDDREHCDRFRFTPEFVTWFSLPTINVSFFPYRLTKEGKERGTTYNRTPFFVPYQSVMKQYSIFTDRTLFKEIQYRMNLSQEDENGRLTAFFQQMKKEERSTLRFMKDGEVEDSVEIDIVGAHLQILYAMAGVELAGDPYDIGFNSFIIRPERYRPLIKRALFLLVNNGDKHKALSSLKGYTSCVDGRMLAHKLYEEAWELFNDAFKSEESLKQKEIVLNKFHAHSILEDALENILDLILQKHAVVASLLEQLTSRKLMRIESEIMLKWLLELSKLGVPTLPIHDAVIVPVSKSQIGLKALSDVWEEFFKIRSNRGKGDTLIHTLAVVKNDKIT